jgi:hypothetical protein
MRLDLDLGSAVLSFTSPSSTGPYPWLERVGALRMAARAGTPSGMTAGETPSVQVTLDNAGKQAARIVDYPLRREAILYDDDGEEYFRGTVAAMTVGRSLVLTIEA